MEKLMKILKGVAMFYIIMFAVIVGLIVTNLLMLLVPD